MSEISKVIDAVIKMELVPFLKQSGFKKKGRNFYREHDNRIEVINIQSSQWNNGQAGRFTLNIGIYFPEIAKLAESPKFIGLPKEYDCTLRERIGLLTSENKDIWWEVDSQSELSLVGSDLATKARQFCLPWLDKMSDLNNVKVSAVNSRNSLLAAVISLYQGDISGSKVHLVVALKEKPLAKSRIKSWGKKHGVLEP
ncbi:DUF4304 domain-containing protein [Vibrio neptunius]|uniref:DUF4304 domain-containing protein n=1 Tax=Vibrio neptunius TaxID=170651 RepID=UPI000695DC9D|nr:DUF4304 domain-containing protein [Vibrio neptunius]